MMNDNRLKCSRKAFLLKGTKCLLKDIQLAKYIYTLKQYFYITSCLNKFNFYIITMIMIQLFDLLPSCTSSMNVKYLLW